MKNTQNIKKNNTKYSNIKFDYTQYMVVEIGPDYKVYTYSLSLHGDLSNMWNEYANPKKKDRIL